MGKKEKEFTTLSEIDHKMQFISVVAVIWDICPVIYRGKLTKLELCLTDHTATKPGFTVKLNLEKETLSQFLNVAKKGNVIQLRDIKVTKNEGEVYGEVNQRDEITLYNDSPQSHKWYPSEKPTAMNDSVKLKIIEIVKWKKANYKQITTLPGNEEDKSKTRRSGLGEEKDQLPSMTQGKTRISDSVVPNKKYPNNTGSNQKTIDNFFFQKENNVKNSPARKSLEGITTLNDRPSRLLRTTKSSSNLKRSPSFSYLKTTKLSNVKDSLILYNLNTSNTSKNRPSLSISKSKKSEPLMILANNKKSTDEKEMGTVETRNKSVEKESLTRLTRATDTSETKKTRSVSSSEEQIALDSSSIKTKNQSKTNKVQLDPTHKISEDTSEDSLVNTSKKSLRNKFLEHIDLKNDSISNKKNLRSLDSKTNDSFPLMNDKPVKLLRTSKSSISPGQAASPSTDPSSTSSSSRRSTTSKSSKLKQSLSLPNLNKSKNLKRSLSISNFNKSNHSTDTSGEASPESNPSKVGLRKSHLLNSSDSTLSVVSSGTLNRSTSSRESLRLKKRHCHKADISSMVTPRKKVKLSPGIVLGKTKVYKSEEDLNYQVNKGNRKKASIEKETVSEFEGVSKNVGMTKNRQVLLQNNGRKSDPKSKPDSAPNGSKKIEQTKNLRGTTLLSKEVVSSKVTTPPNSSNLVVGVSKRNEGVVNKHTRNASNSFNIIKKQSNKGSGKSHGIFETYLKPLTKLQNFLAVADITDISLCDLEEADVPDKVDLQCKVVSEFVLVEEGIQVVRVQDGTVCKCGTLRIPQCQSWDTVVREILDNPIVEEKSPYIDIIIFNYFRLDVPLKVDAFVRINNVMAVNFQLIHDPRQRKTTSELFFCVEGQHANVKKLSLLQIKELNEKIASYPQKPSSNATSTEAIIENPLDAVSCKLKNSSKIDNDNNLSSNKRSPPKATKETKTALKKKKLNNSGPNGEPEITFPCKSSPVKNDMKNGNHSANSGTDKNKDKDSEVFEVKINTSNSSDETMIGETPPLLREIREIMAEESALGFPLTNTEDVHLKNSGSEVTFSQFCEGAKLKGHNFRSSTQTIELKTPNKRKSEDLLGNDSPPNKVIVEDPSKMEPLIYCPSGSSASSAACGSPVNGRHSQEISNPQFSPSVLQGDTITVMSSPKPNGSQFLKASDDSKSDLSGKSSSVKLISSSCSTGTDLEALSGNITSQPKNTIEASEVKQSKPSVLKDLSSDIQEKESHLSNKQLLLSKEKESVSEKITSEEIEIISDNSSIASLVAADNDATIKPTNTFNALISNVNDDPKLNNLKQCVDLIPERCFYKSQEVACSLTELELNQIYEDETSPVKYMTYHANGHLPILTLDIVQNVRRKNSLTLPVVFTSISPSFTDPWMERCFKARCPSCDKLYEVYNASNGKNGDDTSEMSAIAVGSHIVCPDSQCCNSTLGDPEFHFSVEMNLVNGKPITALLQGKHAEQVFGCSAQEAIKNPNLVSEMLGKITNLTLNKRPTQIFVTRENIFNPKSGPLYLTRVEV